jgi:fatty-acyl-CoA synthase
VSERHVVGTILRHRARTTPGRIAIDQDGRRLTYAELDERSDARAAEFVADGLTRGDRVATLTGNSPEHVEVFFACAKTGLILQPLNWRLAPAEIAYQLDDAEPSVLLVEDEHAELAAAALAEAATSPPQRPIVRVASGRSSSSPASAHAHDDDGLLLVYTSGTTGKPKGALLTHGNCWWTSHSFDVSTGVDGDDVVLQILPQFHCGGWNVQALLAWWKGATVVLERAFDAERCLSLIEEKRVTTMMGVPANYLFMSQTPSFASADLSSLRRAVVGGAPMPLPLLETWRTRGVEIVQGYGLTEAAPNVLCLPPEDAVRRAGSAGKPYVHVEASLRDIETGRLLDGAGVGELVVRGPNVFAGYWRAADATAAVFDDGWLLTGDLAERDEEGYYRISGRLKDMYISGGENVYPAEVEDVLHELEGVADAAVVAVADERWGEVGVAFVVAGRSLSEEDVLEFCRKRLAAYKVPKMVRFVDALPRSAMNKVLKDELRAQLEVAA